MNKLKELQAKIIKAVPEINWRKCIACGHIHPQGNNKYCNFNGCQEFLDFGCEKGVRDISLEDVLIALDKENLNYAMTSTGYFIRYGGNKGNSLTHIVTNIEWQLGKTLNNQSEDLINFLYNLLCVKR